MRVDEHLLEDTANELFEDAPCAYLTTQLDGTIVKVNRTFERWTGHRREDVLDQVRFQELLAPGARIYYETHYAPLLQMQGEATEIALEVVRADSTRLPALVNSVVHRDEHDRPRAIRTTLFDATHRRRYEQELLDERTRERQTARSLQESLLNGALPSSPGCELAVFYGPSGRDVAVGGDWYDAFWLEDETHLGLVVGDVVGRGLPAAMTMGHLRSAVRAFASLGLSAPELLGALDTYSRRYGVGQMTTLVYAELELSSGRLRLACAGHQPPLVQPPGADARYVWEGRSLPINAYPGSLARGEAELTLEPRAILLLYTDGLVEHRGRSADEGMATLERLVHEQADRPLPALVDALVRSLAEPAALDDRCLLAVRLASHGAGAI